MLKILDLSLNVALAPAQDESFLLETESALTGGWLVTFAPDNYLPVYGVTNDFLFSVPKCEYVVWFPLTPHE